jgi:hypothetical protein
LLFLVVLSYETHKSGAILMRAGASSAEAFVAFKKYIGALLDLLAPSEEMVDRLRKPEILFFGPDEGTAEYMDWASQTAKRRGFSFWKVHNITCVHICFCLMGFCRLLRLARVLRLAAFRTICTV